jgi:CCR4-NOT transcription complex subunit 2
LSLGTDLTAFGLNLNASDSLFPTFSSPFTEHVLTPDPQFRTPQCYMMHPPSLKAEHLSKFQIETLFYMFYAMPRDILQVYSAQELYRRDWRFHGELRTWLKPRAPIELMQSHPSVQFLYFDCNTWEARLFTAASSRDNLAIGLLTEDEIRVPNVTAAL